jgi:hypothetical protein
MIPSAWISIKSNIIFSTHEPYKCGHKGKKEFKKRAYK